MSEAPEEKQNPAPQSPQDPTPSRSATAPRKPNRKPWIVIGVLAIAAALIAAGVYSGWLAALTAGDGTRSPGEAIGMPPTIVGLTGGSDRIMPLSIVAIACEALDPDEDELTYTWSASGGEISGEGPEVEWLAPETEGYYRVFARVDDGFNAPAEASLSLRVRANQLPEILFMQSEVDDEEDWVVPGAAVHVRCEAEDADGDTLTYRWSATAGELFGQGEAIIWVAPQTLGMHWITVTVEDLYEGSAERSVPVTVSAGEPPAIHAINVEALDTDLFKPYGDSWRIFKERSCVLTALVDDPQGEYTYDWSAEKGTISADGPEATWTAPATPKGWVNIVLQVSDRHGNESSGSVRIYVETCTSCM